MRDATTDGHRVAWHSRGRLWVLEALSAGAGPRRVLVTLGYAGWGAGQLEDEIARNGWITVDAEPSVIFDTPAESQLGNEVLATPAD